MAGIVRSRTERELRRSLVVPWWIFLLLAPVAYVAFAYGLPAFSRSRSGLQLGGLGHVFGLFIGGLIAFLSVVLAYRQHRNRKLLDQQEGLDSIRRLTWQDFERLVCEAYRRRGYSVVPMGGGGADGGVDVILSKDGRHLVQCKQWKAFRVGVKEVRELFGIITAEKAKTGILITSGYFTDEAKAFASGKPLDLIDGEGLLRLVEAAQTGRPQSASTVVARTCPRCGAPMVLRTARQGSAAGRQFWGCSKFPGCRATIDVE
jgi:restriction system protein